MWTNLTRGVTLFVLVVPTFPGHAQLTGDQGELTRLRAQAETSMAQGDPDGAAISIGKAALLASQLGKSRLSQPHHPPYRRMADLFRTQEQVYRAIALFQRSGEPIPASSGVCRLLTLGRRHAALAVENGHAPPDETLHDQIMEWLEIIQELQREWECEP